jgi:uncharacterized membrane protein
VNFDQNGGYATALALSNAVGLRPFLTLALTALAVHFHWLHPSVTYAWMGERNVCIALGVLAALEFLGDKIPAVDHVLHAVHFATKPIAAVLVSGGALASSDPNAAAWATMAGSVLNSLGIHGLVATTRAASTSLRSAPRTRSSASSRTFLRSRRSQWPPSFLLSAPLSPFSR